MEEHFYRKLRSFLACIRLCNYHALRRLKISFQKDGCHWQKQGKRYNFSTHLLFTECPYKYTIVFSKRLEREPLTKI